MKKAKIILSAIAIFAAVGATFAFKATKFSGVVYYTTNAVGQPASSTFGNAKTTTPPNGIQTFYSTIKDAPAVSGRIVADL